MSSLKNEEPTASQREYLQNVNQIKLALPRSVSRRRMFFCVPLFAAAPRGVASSNFLVGQLGPAWNSLFCRGKSSVVEHPGI